MDRFHLLISIRPLWHPSTNLHTADTSGLLWICLHPQHCSLPTWLSHYEATYCGSDSFDRYSAGRISHMGDRPENIHLDWHLVSGRVPRHTGRRARPVMVCGLSIGRKRQWDLGNRDPDTGWTQRHRDAAL
ncbi:hypothetical protein DPEC_G00023830 [Dallia pectoralis]|uniref:Uncharacterized protein n=1 Tax=Dallia pectoralis TaxID=75939 RepID=A0ACC2HHI7_DALPE|nr:hypothetical protein DPEC_G00023830 [Dallia pectoralis]